MLKKIIVSIIIFSITLTPFSFSQKVNAQSIGGTSGNIGAYATGVAPAIAALPLCRTATKTAIKSLFTPGYKEQQEAIRKGKLEAEAAKDQAKTYADSLSVVPIGLQDEVNKAIFETKTFSKDTNKKISASEENDTCLKSIGRLIIKKLLQDMTLSTVKWINEGGPRGGPSFVQNPGTFFKNIAKNEILQFGYEIGDSKNYPFGANFMRSQANAFKQKFADNARYSLDELMQKGDPTFSSASFNADFSQGGWDAWTYMTQVPANNPIGFQLMASNELQKRLEGTSQSTAQELRDSLKEAGGFLGDMRCSADSNITQSDRDKSLAAGEGDPCTKAGGRWEYVTPGKMIADSATKLVNYPDNNLLKADDLNDAVAAILDAVLAKYSGELMDKGIAGLDTNLANVSTNYYQYSNSNQINHDYSEFIIEASSWLQQNPDFDIRTDLNQALIDTQRTYSEKMVEANKELNDLILVTRQLDYCIPGPHPGWENDSTEKLNTMLGKMPPYEKGIDKSAIGVAASWSAKLGKIFPPLGTFSNAYNFLTNLFGGSAEDEEKAYYAYIVDGLTGIQPNADGKMATMQQASNILNTILQRYADIIHQVYDQNPNMPEVTEEAAAEFEKIQGYQRMIEENNKKINKFKGIVTKLNEIKSSVDLLRSKLNTKTISQTEYEEQMKPWITSFGRFSADMVSGDNVANVDGIAKEARDRKEYVYKDLLKGPNGCEKDLESGRSIHLPWQVLSTKRMTYPFPLLYDYNKLSPSEIIPDPWKQYGTYNNKMNSNIFVNSRGVGPGFLSFTRYSRDADSGTAVSGGDATWLLLPEQFPYLQSPNNHPGLLTLYMDADGTGSSSGDRIVNRGGSRNVSVGKNTCSDCNGQFESAIGIY